MRKSSGYILIHRSIAQNSVLRSTEERGAFVDLLLLASYKPEEVTLSGCDFELERGQLVGSLTYLSNQFNWTKKKVRVFLDKLERAGMISRGTIRGTIKGTFRGRVPSVITICNYDKFQGLNVVEGTNEGTFKGTIRGNSIKETKESNTKNSSLRSEQKGWIAPGQEAEAAENTSEASSEPKPKKRNPETQIAEDAAINDKQLEHAAGKGMSEVQAREVFEQFRDYHIAKGNKFRCWNAAWRTWVRNQAKFGKKPGKDRGYRPPADYEADKRRTERERQEEIAKYGKSNGDPTWGYDPEFIASFNGNLPPALTGIYPEDEKN